MLYYFAKNKGIQLVLTVTMLLSPLLAHSTNFLFDSSIVVSDKTKATRAAAITDSFLQVIYKLSAKKYFDPEFVTLPSELNTYLSSYSYNEKDGVINFNAKFNPKMVKRWLDLQNMPYLIEKRPVILLWLGIDDDNTKKIINQDNYMELVQRFEQVAESLGLSITFPILDLEDLDYSQALIDKTTRNATIMQLKNKYTADKVIFADIQKIEETFIYFWDFPNTAKWETTGTLLEDNAEPAILKVFDVLVKQQEESAVMPSNIQNNAILKINVHGVDSLAQYARVKDYLKTLTNVAEVNVDTIADDKAVFSLKTDSDELALKQSIDLDKVLQSIEKDDSINNEVNNSKKNILDLKVVI